MIEKTTAFRVGDQFFPCIEEAQAHELAGVLSAFDNEPRISGLQAAEIILQNKAQVLNILTMTAKSHARARKANGATRKPRAKAPTTGATA